MMWTKPPANNRQAAPAVFNVPVRDDNREDTTPARPETPAANRSTGVKTQGVHPGRLVGFSLPVVGVVAGAAMWMVSPLLAVGVLGGTTAAVGVGYVAHKAWRRSMPRAGRRPATPSRSLFGGRPSSPGRGPISRLLGGGSRGSSGSRGRPSSSGSGAGPRGSGGRGRGLFGLGRRSPSGSGSSTTRRSSRSGQPGGGSTSGGRSLRDRLLGRKRGTQAAGGGSPSAGKPSKRGAASAAGTGPRGRAPRGASSAPGGKQGKGRGIWPFRRNNPGSTGGSGTGKGSKWKKLFGGGSNGASSSPNGGGRGGKKTTGRGHGLPWKNRHSDPKTPKTKKDRGKGWLRLSITDGGGAMLAWQQDRKKRKKKNSTSTGDSEVVATTKSQDTKEFPTGPQRKVQMKKTNLGYRFDDGGWFKPEPPSKKPRKVKASNQVKPTKTKHQPMDDFGFDSPVPARGKPLAAPRPMDDFGFDSPPVEPAPTRKPQAGGGNPSGTERNKKVSTSTESITAGYAQQVDQSTPQTRIQTLSTIADVARADARKSEEKARSYHADAAGLLNSTSPALQAEAEHLKREAARLEQDAQARAGVAHAFEDAAAAEAVSAQPTV